MPQETDRLKLPLPLGNENVTRESINGIFEKIDAGVATQENLDTLREAVSQMDIPDASLTQKGKVQLSDVTNSTAKDKAATPSAVKIAFDEATSAKQLGVEQKANVVAALNSIGVSASTSESWNSLIAQMAGVIRATGNATASQVLSDATFSNASANGLTGTMPNRGPGGTVIPGTTDQVKASGYYSSPITVKGETNLIPANIKNGVMVNSVVGNYLGETIQVLMNTRTLIASKGYVVLSAPANYEILAAFVAIAPATTGSADSMSAGHVRMVDRSTIGLDITTNNTVKSDSRFTLNIFTSSGAIAQLYNDSVSNFYYTYSLICTRR
ncbi:tail fiber protein [Paenibacillus vandeheii]